MSACPVLASRGRAWHAARRQAVEDTRKALSDAVAGTFVSPEEKAFHAALQNEDPRAVRKLWESYSVMRKREIVKTQDPDGAMWDYYIAAHGKPWGTSMALLALAPTLEPVKQ